MNIDQAFPSKYLKESDLKGKEIELQMDGVKLEDVSGDGTEEKPVLYFMNASKGLVLNKTNAGRISLAYGAETETWVGKKLVLYSEMVQFQGRAVPAIRVRVPKEVVAAADDEPPF